MSTLILGIDGGGTKTEAVLANGFGQVLGIGRSGPGNFDDLGAEGAQTHIGEAVHRAFDEAGIAGRRADAAFLGLGGVISERDREIVSTIARNLNLAPEGNVGVDHDCRVALAGGLSGRPGIVLIAGTGSSCYGRTRSGANWRSGGWGHWVSDEGSSYWLGIQAMRGAVQAYDGRGRPTVLLESVIERLGLSDMNDLMHRLYVEGMTRTEVASLARLVVDAAVGGDPVAADNLEEGGAAMAQSIIAVARRLGMDTALCEVALVGGLFSAGPIVIEPLERHTRAALPLVRFLEPELSPSRGAALLALGILDVSVDREILQRLGESIE